MPHQSQQVERGNKQSTHQQGTGKGHSALGRMTAEHMAPALLDLRTEACRLHVVSPRMPKEPWSGGCDGGMTLLCSLPLSCALETAMAVNCM